MLPATTEVVFFAVVVEVVLFTEVEDVVAFEVVVWLFSV
jgi:hypothetical protein